MVALVMPNELRITVTFSTFGGRKFYGSKSYKQNYNFLIEVYRDEIVVHV